MAHIVDIAAKQDVTRRASAEGVLRVAPGTARAIAARRIDKGDVLAVAEVAALQAVKRTPDLLPLCHPIPITSASVRFRIEDDAIRCTVEVGATYRTGVEMEALTGAAVGLLCVWDMVKALEKDADGQYPTARIEDLHVVRKDKGAPA